MFHWSQKTTRARMGAISLLVLLFLLAACSSASPTLLSNSLQGAHSPQKGKNSCMQPPSALHLQSLSDAQLAEMGFPPHAVIDRNPKQWTRVLAMAHTHSCKMIRDAHPFTHRPLRMPKAAATTAAASLGQQVRQLALTAAAASSGQSVNTPDTAGYVTTGQPGQYTAAAVSFMVPTLTPQVNGAPIAYVAAIGGENNMILAGIMSFSTPNFVPPQSDIPFDVFISHTSGVAPMEQQPVFNPRVQAGDTIFAYVDSNLNGNGMSDVYLLDENTGVYSYLPSIPGIADGASAGCLLQSSGGAGNGTILQNFGTVNMDCGVYQEGTPQMGPIGTYPNIPINMVNGGPGATTSDLSPDGLTFSVTWVSPNPGF